MAIEYNTPEGKVRLLIPDTSDENQIFTDDQISAFLSMSAQKVYLAAALAVEVVATDEALVYKIVRSDDQSVNGVTGAELLRLRAKDLRQQQTDEDNASNASQAFTIVFPRQRRPFRPEATPRSWGRGRSC